MDFRLLRSQLGQNTTKTKRVLAKSGSHQVVARGGRVTFVEHEVDDLQYRRQPGGELGPTWDFKRNLALREGPLGADDSLRDGRLRDKKRARYFIDGETTEQPQCERSPRFPREHRMTGHEH